MPQLEVSETSLAQTCSSPEQGFFSPFACTSFMQKDGESFAHCLMSKRMWFLHGRLISISLAFSEIASEWGNSTFESDGSRYSAMNLDCSIQCEIT